MIKLAHYFSRSRVHRRLPIERLAGIEIVYNLTRVIYHL